VMVAMMGGPPERSPLDRCITHRSEYKLPESIGFEGVMGKIAVIKACDGKHTDQVKQNRNTDSCPGPADPENTETHQVQEQKRNDTQPVYLLPVCGSDKINIRF